MDVERSSITVSHTLGRILTWTVKLTCKIATSDLPSLLNMNVQTAAQGLARGRFTSVALVKTFLAMIEEASYHKAVLQINLVLQLHKTEKMSAYNREVEGMCGARSSSCTPLSDRDRPLHGISNWVRDNTATKDRLNMSAGSFTLVGSKPATGSSIISKSRAAGVVILGRRTFQNGPISGGGISETDGVWADCGHILSRILCLMGAALGQLYRQL